MALKRERSFSDDELSDHKNIRLDSDELDTDERDSDELDADERDSDSEDFREDEDSSGGGSEVDSNGWSVDGSVPKLQTDEDCDVEETGVVIHETENTAVKQEVLPKNTPANGDMSSKSVSELKKELCVLMRLHSKNSGDFAIGGVLKEAELSNVPLIEIKEYGIMSVPLNKVVFESIKNLFRQSPYGLGEQTLVDTSVRNSFQLEPEKFEIKNDQFVKQVSVLIEQKIKPALGLVGARIYGKIYKLLIYEAGGKFEEHRDTEKEDNMFGTLIVQLPSVFSGGDLVVKHNKSSRVYNNDCAGSSTHCMFVAHYASCPHELKEVTSGYRAALVYSLCWDGNGLKPSPYVASTNAVRLCNMLNEFMDCPKVSYLCWGLDYEYSNASVKHGSLDFFKGKDKNVVSGLKNALDYDRMQFGKDKWELFIASANKKVSEYGDCGGGCGRYDDGCNGNCGGEWYEDEREFGLDEFVSLTGNSKNAGNLSFDFDPEEDIINFRRTKKSGKVKGKNSKESDEEFWGDHDIGEGCSGPSGNEGSTRERWYQKKVLVLWRTDCSLAIKCQSSMSDGVSHILNLLRKGETEEGKKGFLYLWNELGNMESSNGMLTNMLKMCNILKEKEKAGSLLKLLQKFGIASDNMGKVIAEASHIFRNEQQRNMIKEIIKKTKQSDIKHILSYCNNMDWLEPIEVIQLVVGYVLQDPKKQDTGYYRSYEYYGSNWSRSSSNRTPETALVLQYMFQKNNFPDTELDKLISKIANLSDVSPSINLAIDNHNTKVLNLLIMRFVELACNTLKPDEPKKSEKFTAVTDIFKAIVAGPLKSAKLLESIAMLVSIITSLSNSENQQMLLKHLVARTLAQHTNKKSIPECLMNTCRARITHLEGVVSRGKPAMSWIQPNAVVAGYPLAEEFFRGPNQTFTLRGFSGIWDARNWASTHAKDRGCSMKLTATGIGKKAAVEIVKTKAGYEEQVVVFNKNVAEYRKLVKVVPGHKSVILPADKAQKLTSSGVTNKSSGVTKSATCNVITID